MFKVLEPHCEPKRGTKHSAYVDLFSREDVVIGAGETKVIKLGVKLDLEHIIREVKRDVYLRHLKDDEDMYSMAFDFFLKSHYLEVALRSSLAVKGLIIANGIGIIDLDYPDEIGLIVHNPITGITKHPKNDTEYFEHFTCCNDSNTYVFKISKGDKVAQCTLKEHKGYLMGYESDVVRDGGFGSTGA